MNISYFCIFLFRQLQDAEGKCRITFPQTPQKKHFFSTFVGASPSPFAGRFFLLAKKSERVKP